MSASASRGRLTVATRLLEQRWSETRQAWRDQKAGDFHEAYLADLTPRVNAALRVLEDLDKLLDQIHAECDD